jgi:outer membrane protein W
MKLTLSAGLMALTVSSIMSLSPAALAQNDALLNETQDILNSDQIDIDGTYRKETAADRIEKMRKKLEAQNEQMVQKKIEDIRIKQETELSNKLQKAFQGNMQAMDNVQDSVGTYQAAPQRVIAPMPVEQKSDLKNKVIPFFGVKQFDGESIDSFEAKVNAGLSMENMITERLSVGLGVNYTAMDITDVAYYNGFNQFNFGFNDGDEISYSNVNVSINGKFFITTDSKIRPYLGAGLGYNRTSLKYDEQNSQFNNGFGGNFNGTNEDSKVSGSNVTGTGAIGAEILFTDSIGVNLEFNYTRAITSAFDGTNTFRTGFNDQAKANLETLGDNLEESDVAALNIGFVVKF